MPLHPPKAPQRGLEPQQPFWHPMGKKPLVPKRKRKSRFCSVPPILRSFRFKLEYHVRWHWMPRVPQSFDFTLASYDLQLLPSTPSPSPWQFPLSPLRKLALLLECCGLMRFCRQPRKRLLLNSTRCWMQPSYNVRR